MNDAEERVLAAAREAYRELKDVTTDETVAALAPNAAFTLGETIGLLTRLCARLESST